LDLTATWDLPTIPRSKEAAKKAIDKYGTGCAGSRFSERYTLDIHIELEESSCRPGRERTPHYATPPDSRLTLAWYQSLPGAQDHILLDVLDHASIIEGSRLSFSKVLKYAHNDMQDLEKKLKRCASGTA
jgi:8-amino-7-oxononanoate synthase